MLAARSSQPLHLRPLAAGVPRRYHEVVDYAVGLASALGVRLPSFTVRWVVAPETPEANFGETTTPMDPSQPATITLRADAFVGNEAALFSTIAHELKHVLDGTLIREGVSADILEVRADAFARLLLLEAQRVPHGGA